MKRSKLFSVLVLTLFLSGEAFSQSFQFSGGSTTGGSSSSYSTSSYEQSGRVPGDGQSCRVNDYIKMDYLRSLFNSSQEDNFKVVINKSQTKLEIHHPGYITNCLDLQFEVDIYSGNNVTVRAKNKEFQSEYNSDTGYDPKKQAFQKYVACLKEQGVIVEVPGSNGKVYKFDKDGPNVKYMPPGVKTLAIRNGKVDPSSKVKLDPKKDVKAYFLSPNTADSGDMNTKFPADNAPNFNACYWPEHFNTEKNPVAYLSPDSRAEKAVENCKDNYQDIVKALKSLDRSVLGNYEELRSILEKALVETLDEEAQAIYKKMEKIKDKVSFENGEPDVDEDEAADLMEDYADLMRNLNVKVLEPYLKRMDELMTELDNTNDDAREAKIRERIKTLKKKIAYYSDKTKTLGYNDMMKLGRHYGLTSDARVIEGFRLKSLVYGSMGSTITHPTKKKKVKVNFNTAEDIVNDAVTHFDKKIADVWETEAAVRSGDASAVRGAQSRHTALTRARDERFKSSMQKIQSDYKSCVGWFHTQYKIQKCQQKAQASQQRAMAQRAYYNRQIGQASTQYNHYMGIYQQYQRSLASTDGASSFDDPFGIYQDPFGSYNMDPMSYYNMGVGNTMGGANFNPFGGAGMYNGMGTMQNYNMMPF